MMVNKGFVLFVVLIFLQIFSMLSLYSLSGATTIMRSTQTAWEERAHRRMSQHMLANIENHIQIDRRCVVEKKLPAEFAQKPLAWWKQYACADVLEGFLYYYVLEDLGSDTCAIVEKYDINQILTANYYRVTLLSTVDLYHLMQSTFVIGSSRDEVCLKTERHVQTGQQMQRELLRREIS